jgi:hypothetical protein
MASPHRHSHAPADAAASSWDDHSRSHPSSLPVRRQLSQPPSFTQSQPQPSQLPSLPPRVPTINNNITNNKRRKKAKHHRRRHVPVGPAGVWFQTHQQQQQQQQHDSSLSIRKQQQQKQSSHENNNNNTDENNENDNNDDENDENDVLTSLARPTNAATGGVNFYSNAWMCMQCQLDLVTPTLPVMSLSVAERYKAIRPHVPTNYMLLAEILAGKADCTWKVPAGVSVLVLVHTIQSLADHLWTVELQDETGCSVTAWIQPSLVQEEQQRQVPAYVAAGYVWLLQDVTIQLVSRSSEQHDNDQVEQQQQQESDDDTEETNATATTQQQENSNVKMDRLLLVSERNIRRVWTPAQAEKEVSDQDYIAWMERRNSLTTTAATAAISTASGNANANVNTESSQSSQSSQSSFAAAAVAVNNGHRGNHSSLHTTHASNNGGNHGIRNDNRPTREENDPDDDTDEEEFTFEEDPPPPQPVSHSNMQDVAPRIHSLHAAQRPSPTTAATATAANGQGNHSSLHTTHVSNNGGNSGIRNDNRPTREENDPNDDTNEEEFTFEEDPPPPVSHSNVEDVAPRIQSLHTAQRPSVPRPPPTAANSQANTRDRASLEQSSSLIQYGTSMSSQPARDTTASRVPIVDSSGPRRIDKTTQSQAPANAPRDDFRQFAASPITAMHSQPSSSTATNLPARRSPPPPPPPQSQRSPRPAAPTNLQQFSATPVNHPPSNTKHLSQRSHSATSDHPLGSPVPGQQTTEKTKTNSASKRTPGSARTTSSKKKRKKSIRPKAAASTTTTTTTTATSPKTPSNLWTATDASLLDMFEDDDSDSDDDDDDDIASSPLAANPVARATSVQESSKDAASHEPVDRAASNVKSSLFQAAAFAGMDMDDLFDDDEDD